MYDEDALNKIAQRHLGEIAFDNPSSALESIMIIVESTGRTIDGWSDE